MDEISAVRQECGIISRQEHLRPAHQPISYSSVMEEVCARTGQSKKEYERNLKILKDTPFFGDVVKGHYFRDGEGVPRDYYKAAAHYAKAANAGNPEGMFNLALLYKNGQGVARDFNESLRWLLKAAEGKAPIMVDVKNIC
uniref:Sel1 repeat family protein n=1 Tax=Panagrolaimus superbus TaxID=310955 RepID=A0A914ZD09_9BILA